jgi:hypothetical protein
MSKSIISWAVDDWRFREVRRKSKRKEEIEWRKAALEDMEEWENDNDE